MRGEARRTACNRRRSVIVPTLVSAVLLSVCAIAIPGSALASGSASVLPADVSGLSPAEGTVGVSVTIDGTGFSGATEVDFGSASASFIVDSDSQITASVPLGAQSGPVTVQTPSGPMESAGTFTFIPIQHVVIVDEENHSFNDMLGKFCVDQADGTIVRSGDNSSCDGTDQGVLLNGSSIPLTSEPNGGLPMVAHGVADQANAMDGGKMDGFQLVRGCRSTDNPAYACFSQYDPLAGPCGKTQTQTCIPNIVQWAKSFAISDQTFEFRQTPSWAGHMVLADATLEHFQGGVPKKEMPGLTSYVGWGCDSGLLTPWVHTDGTKSLVPPCIPNAAGAMGPVYDGTTYAKKQHATYVPTMFDRLDSAARSWRIYGGGGSIQGGKKPSAYIWTICPTFWECLGSSQINNLVPNTQFATDALAGQLPSVSYVTPVANASMHQPSAASVGDNWLAKSVIGPAMAGPEWSSTAIFVTWDDCGCFYDAVPPPSPEWGVRVPMLIISPWAKPGYTDSQPATFVSMLAFVEHTFNLPPLNPCATVGATDPNCTDDLVGADGQPMYDYMGAFDFGQTPLTPTKIVQTPLDRHDQIHEAAWARTAGDEDT